MAFDGYSSEQIRSIVSDMQTTQIHDDETKRSYFKDKYSEFATKFPRLFDAACKSSFQMQYLDFMLSQRDKLYSNTTFDKTTVESADKIVYDKLREDFVDPVISRNTTS